MDGKKLPDGVATWHKHFADFYFHFSEPKIMTAFKALWDLEVTQFSIPDFRDAIELYAHFLVDAGARCAFMRLILANPQFKPTEVPVKTIEALSTNSDLENLKKSKDNKLVTFWKNKKEDVIGFFQISYRINNFLSKWNSSPIKSDDIPHIDNGWKGAQVLHDWVGQSSSRANKALLLMVQVSDLRPLSFSVNELKQLTDEVRPVTNSPPAPTVTMNIGSINAKNSYVAEHITADVFAPRFGTIIYQPANDLTGDNLFRSHCENFQNIFNKSGVLQLFTKVWNSYSFTALPDFGTGDDGAYNWYNHFHSRISLRNELIYILQTHPEFRPASLLINDLPKLATRQVPYDLPKNMKF